MPLRQKSFVGFRFAAKFMEHKEAQKAQMMKVPALVVQFGAKT